MGDISDIDPEWPAAAAASVESNAATSDAVVIARQTATKKTVTNKRVKSNVCDLVAASKSKSRFFD